MRVPDRQARAPGCPTRLCRASPSCPPPTGAFFTVKISDVPLSIKGFNYFPLRGGDHATFDAATRTTTVYYDPQRAERMFTALEANGFNTVRVFIIGRSPAINPGIAGDPDTQGLNQPYM